MLLDSLRFSFYFICSWSLCCLCDIFCCLALTYWLITQGFVLCLHKARHVAVVQPLLGRPATSSTCASYSETKILIESFRNEHMSKHQSRNTDHLLHQSAPWMQFTWMEVACVVSINTLHRYRTVSIGSLAWCWVSNRMWLEQSINHDGTIVT